ncbi:uncharacterized protein LOC134701956 [Mytilus trossulus]|uniref:uncharacterized protein LOC134701956 n=1 Tax=Mytilus trossulus TaxID=6551 RepID=UPI0030046523
MKFSVKTCHHANLILSAAVDLQSSDLYEISIGDAGNNRTKLHKKDTSISIFIHTPGIVSCTEQITFVISWKLNGNILLIKETQNGTEIIFDWTDPSPFVIKGVGIATAWGSDGLWVIEHTAVFTGHYCFVPGTYGFMTLLSTTIERSDIGCLSQCSPNDNCLGVNFNSDTYECQIISAAQPIIKGILEDWVLYTKCLQGDMMCLVCLE